LEKYDALICPVNVYPALPHGVIFDLDKLPAFRIDLIVFGTRYAKAQV